MTSQCGDGELVSWDWFCITDGSSFGCLVYIGYSDMSLSDRNYRIAVLVLQYLEVLIGQNSVYLVLAGSTSRLWPFE